MGMVTIDQFKEIIGEGMFEPTDHPNKLLMGSLKSLQYRYIKFCNDCRFCFTPTYRVSDACWKSVVEEKQCYLCLSCLDKRHVSKHGYHLHRLDFEDGVPANQALLFGYNMGLREARS